MKKDRDDGGQAFPGESFFQSGAASSFHSGMTLRQWYKGMVASSTPVGNYYSAEFAARVAEIADLLIAEDNA